MEYKKIHSWIKNTNSPKRKAHIYKINTKKKSAGSEHAEALEEWRSGIESFGKLIGADLTLMNQLMGRGSSNRAGLKAIAERIEEIC